MIGYGVFGVTSIDLVAGELRCDAQVFLSSPAEIARAAGEA
jgi:hypothetical protein